MQRTFFRNRELRQQRILHGQTSMLEHLDRRRFLFPRPAAGRQVTQACSAERSLND